MSRVFAHLSSPSGRAPSHALAIVMLHTPLHLAERLAGFVTSRAVDSELLLLAIRRVMQWPLLEKLATWCTMLLRGLAFARQFSALNRVTILCIHQVFFQLLVPALRPGALELAEFMLLGFQHNPRPFHDIVPHIPPIMASIAAESRPHAGQPLASPPFLTAAVIQSHALALGSGPMLQDPGGSGDVRPPQPESLKVLERMSNLIQALLFHFPGFPELYQPLLRLTQFSVSFFFPRISASRDL